MSKSETETVHGEVVSTYESRSELPRLTRQGMPWLEEEATYKLVKVTDEDKEIDE